MKIKFFFTPICVVMAVLGFLFGAYMLYFGWHHSTAPDPALVNYANRQFNMGWRMFLGSVVLGVLAEISLALHKDK